MPERQRRSGKKPGTPARTGGGTGVNSRRWVFWALVAVAVILVGLLLSKPALLARDAPEGSLRVRIDMSGFQPRIIRVRAGQPVRITLVNPDDRFHTDGGGYHNFVVEALGVWQVVAPLSTQTFPLAAPAPGRYEFYCDICCGGKDNPAMRGVLVVE